MRIIRTLWVSCLILIALFVICLVTYFLIPSTLDWLRNLLLNLATEILGILATIILIERVLRAKEALHEKEESRKYQTVAFRHLLIPLTNHLRMFTNVLVAVSNAPPQKSFENVRELFDSHYFAQLELLDFSKDAPPAGAKWSDYLIKECSRFKDALTRTLDRYSFYLDSEVVDLMEEMINSSFMDFIVAAPKWYELKLKMRPGSVGEWNLFTEKILYGGGVKSTKKYADRFSRLVEIYNQHVPEEKVIKPDERYWRNNSIRGYGSGRFERDT